MSFVRTATLTVLLIVGCAPQPDAPQQSTTVFVASPPTDRCREFVAPALAEFPQCTELLRTASHGTCTSDPAWEGSRQLALRNGSSSERYRAWVESYCAFLELSAHDR